MKLSAVWPVLGGIIIDAYSLMQAMNCESDPKRWTCPRHFRLIQ